ncbi:MAG: terminase small subunit [Oscillospiraceae bacterium]|nr:terminase small subunit [Oscillospiraceae bacterium]
MTVRQRAFIKHYTQHGIAAKAARQAGYSPNGANRMGYYLKWRLRHHLYLARFKRLPTVELKRDLARYITPYAEGE